MLKNVKNHCKSKIGLALGSGDHIIRKTMDKFQFYIEIPKRKSSIFSQNLFIFLSNCKFHPKQCIQKSGSTGLLRWISPSFLGDLKGFILESSKLATVACDKFYNIARPLKWAYIRVPVAHISFLEKTEEQPKIAPAYYYYIYCEAEAGWEFHAPSQGSNNMRPGNPGAISFNFSARELLASLILYFLPYTFECRTYNNAPRKTKTTTTKTTTRTVSKYFRKHTKRQVITFPKYA